MSSRGAHAVYLYLDASALVKLVPAEALSEPVIVRARRLRALRALDAIHLATAIELGAEVEAFVAYDRRRLDAASVAGLSIPDFVRPDFAGARRLEIPDFVRPDFAGARRLDDVR